MKINEKLKLVLRDVYLYDIEACHYTIMKKLGYDLSDLDQNDKLQRNIQIGQMMRKNPKLTTVLRTTTKTLIDEYMLRNNIKDDDIVIRQYDGVLLMKRLHETNIQEIPLNMRKYFEIFIISIDRKMYIACDSNREITIKGVPFRYEKMDQIYKRLCQINFANKTSIFKSLHKLKYDFLHSNDANLFGVPVKGDKYNVYLKGYGEIEISKQTLKIMDTDDIDKERYFNFYITPFTKSIVIENVR